MSNINKNYVTLHCHSHFSSLDGFIRFEDIYDVNKNLLTQGLMSKLKENKMKACAITDHGNISVSAVAPKHFKEAGIKYIPGIEFYIVGDRTNKVRGEQKNNHLIALAMNEKGWKNILKLNYYGYKDGAVSVYDRTIPRIDLSLIREMSEGVIFSSACLAGTPVQLMLQGKMSEAVEYVNEMKRITFNKDLGKSLYWLEVQPVDCFQVLESSNTLNIDKVWIKEQAIAQKQMNDSIVWLSEKTNVPIIATTDSHYISRNDRESHLLLLAIQSKKTIYDSVESGRLAFEATSLLSYNEMLEVFAETSSGYNSFSKDQVEEWLENTNKVADLIEEPKYLADDSYKIPEYPVHEEEDYQNFLEWKKNRK